MFVCVARVTLDIPAAGSLKGKRQVLRRVTDRVKARFNVAVAEVDDNDVWTRAVIALSVVGNERRHVNEQMDKILQYIEDMYVAPVTNRELEILSFGEDLFSDGAAQEEDDVTRLLMPRNDRSLAEAEGLGDWEDRHDRQAPPPSPSAQGRAAATAAAGKARQKQLSLEQARALARSLRNRREWEKP